MLALAFESFWLWYLAGVALWAFLGILVSAWQRLSLGVGAVVGGIFWFVGIAVLAVVGLLRAAAVRRGRELGWRGAPSAVGHAGYSPFGGAPAGGAGSAPGGYPSATGGFPVGGSGFPPGGGGFPAGGNGFPPGGGYSSPAAVPTGPPAPAMPAPRSVDLRPRLVVAGALLGGLAILVSIVLPWGTGRIAWSKHHSHVSGSLAPDSAAPVAVLIALSGLVVLAVGGAMYRRPHVLLPGLSALVVTWWFCLVVEWLLLDAHTSSVTNTASGLAGDRGSASLSTAAGVWLMLLGCVAVYVWCTVVTMDMLRGRRPFGSPRSGSPSALGWAG